jgi:hypothetical protein
MPMLATYDASGALIKPTTHNGDLGNLPVALWPLMLERRWVVWKWVLRKKKSEAIWTKPPFQPSAPRTHAKVDDPATWGTYVEAIACWMRGECDGIGFMLDKAYVGVADLDHAYDEAGGRMPWTEDLLRGAKRAYVELSVSGRGLHIIGRAMGDELGRKFNLDPNRKPDGPALELYRNTARYITISGLEVSAIGTLPNIDAMLDRLRAQYDAPERQMDSCDLSRVDRVTVVLDDVAMLLKGVDEATADRSANVASAVWRLAARGMGPEAIESAVRRYMPVSAGKYEADGRLREEIERCYGKWRAERRLNGSGVQPIALRAPPPPVTSPGGPAAPSQGSQGGVGGGGGGTAGPPPGGAGGAGGGGPGVGGVPLPHIYIRGGRLPEAVIEAEGALMQSGIGGVELFSRDGVLMRTFLSEFRTAQGEAGRAWRMEPVSAEWCGARRGFRLFKFLDLPPARGFQCPDGLETVASH